MKIPKVICIPNYNTTKWGYREVYMLQEPFDFSKAKRIFVYKDGRIFWKGRLARRDFNIKYHRGRIKAEMKKSIKIQFDFLGTKFTYNRLVLCAWDETFNILDPRMKVVCNKKHPYSHNIRYLTWDYNKGNKKILSDAQEKAVQWLYANKNTSYRLLADAYGVSHITIRNIIKGRQ